MTVATTQQKRQAIARIQSRLNWNQDMLEERVWSICKCSPSRLQGNILDRFYRYMLTMQDLMDS